MKTTQDVWLKISKIHGDGEVGFILDKSFVQPEGVLDSPIHVWRRYTVWSDQHIKPSGEYGSYRETGI